MRWTKDALEQLLLGRRVVATRSEKDGSTWGDSFKVEQLLVWDDCITLSGDGASVSVKYDAFQGLFAGKPSVHPETYWKSGVTIHLEHAPAREPAKPALPAKWEERWWDVYLRHYVKGFPNAGEIADKAIEVARKHLEGEP